MRSDDSRCALCKVKKMHVAAQPVHLNTAGFNDNARALLLAGTA